MSNITNHEEAFELACHTREHSNIARCYLEYHAFFNDCFNTQIFEELYQNFKIRIIEEISVDAPDLRTMGRLIDTANKTKDE